MKKFKSALKYGSAVVVTAAMPAFAFADGIGDVGSTISGEIAKVVPVISSAGLALISIYVTILSWNLVKGIAKRG